MAKRNATTAPAPEKGPAAIDRSRRLSTVLCLVIGLCAAALWPDLVGHQSVYTDIVNSIEGIGNSRLLCLCGQSLMALLCIAVPRFLKRSITVFLLIMVALSLVATLYFLAVPGAMAATAPLPRTLAMLSLVITGMGYALLFVSLLSQLAFLDSIPETVGIITGALVVKIIIAAAIQQFATREAIITIAAGSAVVATAMTCTVKSLLDADEATVDLASLPKQGKPESQAFLVMLAIVSILRASIRILSNMGFWGQGSAQSDQTPFMLLLSIVIIAGIVYATFVLNRKTDVFGLFLPALLVILAGFLLLDPLTVSLVPALAGLAFLGTVIDVYTCVVYWLSITLAIRSLGLYPYLIAGIAFGLFSVSSIPLVLLLQNNTEAGGLLVILMLYCFVVIMAVVYMHPRDRQATPDAGETEEQTPEARLLSMAQRYALSPRETDVFLLLAQGRSRSFIESELFMAEGTVKTHTTRIYQKLGVSNKQELISLVQTEC